MIGEKIWTIKDNSGIKTAKQLKIQYSKCKVEKPGDMLIIFPRKFKYIRVIKRQKYWGLVIGLKRKLVRYNGHTIKGYSNSILILNNRKKFLGTRVFGPLYREVRQRRGSYVYKKIYARTGFFI
jgi:Ribosomal protein L14